MELPAIGQRVEVMYGACCFGHTTGTVGKVVEPEDHMTLGPYAICVQTKQGAIFYHCVDCLRPLPTEVNNADR